MRISDWSSDVCSSDLGKAPGVPIPHAEQAEDDRQVGRQRRRAEVLVHLAGALEEFVEARRPDRNHHRQADGGPHRIAPADPVPEAEDAALLNAEVGHRSEEHTSELQSLMRTSYAVFCLQ